MFCSTLYVCYSINDFGVMQAGISMLSFLANNPQYGPDELFVLDYGIVASNKGRLNDIAARYGKRVTYLVAKPVTDAVRRAYPHLRGWRGTMAPNAKAFMDKIVPDYVERLLFVDADTLVTGPVDELVHLDMEGAALAAVPQVGESNAIRQGRLRLYSGSSIYFNSGVLLYNLAVWRKEDCYQMVIDILRKKRQLYSPDQTLLNNAIPARLQKRLPLKYNYLTHWYHPKQERRHLSMGHIYTDDEIEEAMSHPVIIHYTGGDHQARPWHRGCRSYRAEEYLHYKALSPWKDVPLFPRQPNQREGVVGRITLWRFWMLSRQPSYALAQATLFLLRKILRLKARMHKLPPSWQEGIEEEH